MTQIPPRKISPVEQLFQLVKRVLWSIYLIFWLSWVACSGVLGGIWIAKSRSDFEPVSGANEAFSDWQFLLVAIAFASIYISFRLSAHLMRPERIWEGTRNLVDLTRKLEARKQGKAQAGKSRFSAPQESKEDDRSKLAYAVQHILTRIVIAHLTLWILVEIPLILGLVDFLLHEDWRVFLCLGLLTAVGLYLRRPIKSRLDELMAPVANLTE